MNHKLSVAFALVMMMSLLAIPRSHAQTGAPGPYYASPSWDQTLPCPTQSNCPRFIVLSNMKSEAVLDRETGLVWERSPSASLFPIAAGQAILHCNISNVGNRRGWRLPSLQELETLIDADPANTSAPRLPLGHPFKNVQTGDEALYWSANQLGAGNGIGNSQFAWIMFMGTGAPGGESVQVPHFVWCVLGGKGEDIQ